VADLVICCRRLELLEPGAPTDRRERSDRYRRCRRACAQLPNLQRPESGTLRLGRMSPRINAKRAKMVAS